MMEIIIALTAMLMILGMAGGSLLFVTFGIPTLNKLRDNQKYTIAVPGWKTRLKGPLPSGITPEEVARGLELFSEQAIKIKNYDKKDLKNSLNGLAIEFIKANNKDNKRYLLLDNGLRIAGDHSGNYIRLVFLASDTLDKTAFFHELGHEAHELEKKEDYKHEDDSMWKNIVPMCKSKF